ncbi:hypothetical protein DFH09DRAFT_1076640 [Mycena vulgaris]|nr:hypothetical protein DFH09DRAFT_1076640 [Mycena vulgaris]
MLSGIVSCGDGISGTRNMHKPVSRLREQTGLPSRLASRSAGLGLGATLKSKPNSEKARLRGRKPVLQTENELSAAGYRHTKHIVVGFQFTSISEVTAGQGDTSLYLRGNQITSDTS